MRAVRPGPGLLEGMEAAVRKAGARALAAFRARAFTVSWKPDGSPVTDMDLALELALAEALEPLLPGAAFQGEETGSSGEAEWTWVVDPIDGTRNFVAGVPLFATLVALCRHGLPEFAVLHAPTLDELYTAGRGQGAFLNGARLRVDRGVDRLEAAFVLSGSPATFEEQGLGSFWNRLVASAARYRTYGDFFGYTLVARGAAHVMVDGQAKAHDYAAPMLLVEEAGGRFTDLGGRPRLESGTGLATNGLVHGEILELAGGGHGT